MNLEQEILKSIEKICWGRVYIDDISTAQKHTYAQFVTHAINTARRLRTRGKDQLVMLLENRYEMVVLYFAAMIGRLKICPIDLLKGDKEIDKIVTLYPEALFITEGERTAGIPMFDGVDVGDICEFRAGELDLHDIEAAFAGIEWHAPFLTTYTSGTSGEMKGVEHSAYNLFASAVVFRDHHGMNVESAFYHVMPMAYMAGILNTLIVPFVANARVAIGPRFSPMLAASFWKKIQGLNLNTFWLSPTMAAMVLKMDRGNIGIEYLTKTECLFISATAPLSEKLQREFYGRYGTQLYQSYGLSETLFISSECAATKGEKLTCGKPLAGVELLFDDGEILQKVPWMFLRYTNVLTENYFIAKYYKTGDLGELDASGNLVINGRHKDLIIRGGINISGKLIEDTILKLDEIEEAAVFALPDPMMGEKIALAYVGSKSENPSELNRRIQDRVLSDLGAASRIDKIIPCKEIPKNINGKVDRIRLAALYSGD